MDNIITEKVLHHIYYAAKKLLRPLSSFNIVLSNDVTWSASLASSGNKKGIYTLIKVSSNVVRTLIILLATPKVYPLRL
jgi:hypothetical protein